MQFEDVVDRGELAQDRFDNARIQHLLAQIGKDGTTKLRMRIVEVLLAEREAGRDAAASIRVLGSWVAQARSGRTARGHQRGRSRTGRGSGRSRGRGIADADRQAPHRTGYRQGCHPSRRRRHSELTPLEES
ncbi:hypothetical protein [Microbacterium sp. KHB019]|uniref:hypothetical protein n=1 Tax=Microbacterium sp. KHB019 TaxID=3129770 RepID=UPI00307A9EB2